MGKLIVEKRIELLIYPLLVIEELFLEDGQVRFLNLKILHPFLYHFYVLPDALYPAVRQLGPILVLNDINNTLSFNFLKLSSTKFFIF